MTRTVVTVLIALLAALSARADRITLKDGGVIEGRVAAETDRETTLEVLLNGKIVRIGLQTERIEARERAVSVLEAYDAELKRADPKSADAQADLAAWCLERKWPEKAETHLRAALLRAPDHALAGRLAKSLGWTRKDDRWQTEAERMQAQGFEKVGERWVTRQDAARIQQDEADRRAESQRDTDRQGVEYHLKRAESTLADARKELDRARASSAQAEDRKSELADLARGQADLVESFKPQEESIRFEIEKLEAWLRKPTLCDCEDKTTCPHDRYRATAWLEAAYSRLNRIRKERKEAERELTRLKESILTQDLVIRSRRETVDRAEQVANGRAAEVDRLKTKLTVLR